MDSKDIHPSNFYYELPKEKIAQTPLSNRSDSKLLHYQYGNITHKKFNELPQLISQKSLIVLNNTKVIPARLIFWKDSGARIEIFLLDPLEPTLVMEAIMNVKKSCRWHCIIGNAKKWKIKTSLSIKIKGGLITAERAKENEVVFSWNHDLTWSELLNDLGNLPLPPYIERNPDLQDQDRYQTVYSKYEGAVAAPTAGLHFTENILIQLGTDHKVDYLTLHVSAGTFQPIKTSAADHPMHQEQLIITKENLLNILDNDQIIAVGTTSLRTLESIYWYGVKLLNGGVDFFIPKLYPYQHAHLLPSKKAAINAILDHMRHSELTELQGYTEIFIFPGYEFKIVKKLITNFHMPGTTLMMLIAAFCGADWNKIYQAALGDNYRFLSYGDSSFLEPMPSINPLEG